MGVDFSSKQGRMSAWLKALGRLDDGPVYWWFTGITHGLTPHEGLVPLFRHENYSFGPYRKVSRHRHESVMQDITFYRDMKSGELIRSFVMPYTNEERPIVEVVTNDINNFYDVEGDSGFVADGQDMAQPFEIDVMEVANTVWMTRTMDWAFPNPLDPDTHKQAYSGPMIRLQMESTLHVDRDKLSDATATSVDARISYEAVTPWFPWMHMGDRPGYLITRATGAKLSSYKELPEDVMRASEERFPGCATGTAAPPQGKDPWTDYMQAMKA